MRRERGRERETERRREREREEREGEEERRGGINPKIQRKEAVCLLGSQLHNPI